MDDASTSHGQLISGPVLCEKPLDINKILDNKQDFQATTNIRLQWSKFIHGLKDLLAYSRKKLTSDNKPA